MKLNSSTALQKFENHVADRSSFTIVYLLHCLSTELKKRIFCFRFFSIIARKGMTSSKALRKLSKIFSIITHQLKRKRRKWICCFVLCSMPNVKLFYLMLSKIQPFTQSTTCRARERLNISNQPLCKTVKNLILFKRVSGS